MEQLLLDLVPFEEADGCYETRDYDEEQGEEDHQDYDHSGAGLLSYWHLRGGGTRCGCGYCGGPPCGCGCSCGGGGGWNALWLYKISEKSVATYEHGRAIFVRNHLNGVNLKLVVSDFYILCFLQHY